MASISVISPMLDKDSLPAMSAMIDTETSVNHLVEHAANRKKLGKVYCDDSQEKSHQKLGYGAEDKFKVKPKREFVWTNFHCVLCLGICGFTIFWTILLLRLYLPVDNVAMVWWLDMWKQHG